VITSPATVAWQKWRRVRQAHRRQLSWGLAFLAPLALVLGFWLAGTFHLLNFGDDGEELLVKLGNPDGEASPLSVTAQPDPVLAFVQAQAVTEAALVEDEPDPLAEPDPVPVPVPQPQPEAKPVTKPEVKPEAKPVTKPVDPAPKPEPVPATTVIKGSEAGNSAQAVFEGTLKGIRKNLQIPIYLYMPLPRTVDAGLLDKVKDDALNTADENKKTLLAVYEMGTALRLKGQPLLEKRPEFWMLLLKAGYDMAKADYKTERRLQTITLAFKLTAATDTREPRLIDIKLEKSSGDAEIDGIVRSVFEEYRYSNPTGETVAGRFTYEF